MKQSASEQLSRLCNLKPQIVVLNFCLKNIIFREPPKYKEVFPDFTTSENSIHLLNILSVYDVYRSTHYKNKSTISIQDIIPEYKAINFCLDELKNDNVPDDCKSFLVSQIQNTFWFYED